MNMLKCFFTILLLAILLAPRAFAQYPQTTYPWGESSKRVIGKPIPPVIRRTLGAQGTTDVRIYESGNSQSEMSIAIDPFNSERLLVGANTINPAGTYFGQGYYYSSDGGTLWDGNDILPQTSHSASDPAVAFDADGNAYFHFLDGNSFSGPVLAYVAKSTNGGLTWQNRVEIPGVGNGDKGHVTIDVTHGPFRNNLYAALTDISLTGWPVLASRSTDQGSSFSSAVSISDDVTSLYTQGVNLAIGPSGEVYAVWAIGDDWGQGLYGSDGIGFNKSVDGGANWQTSRRIFDIEGSRDWWTNKNPLGQQAPVRMNDFPCIAVDRSGGIWNGTIYMVWGNYGAGADRADILFSKSTDGGDSWSAPYRVNDDNTSNDQWFPWIAVNPYGVISVIFYDSRNDPNNQLTEVWVAQSADGGTSFSNFQVSDVPFMPFPILGENVADGYMGDYIGITSAAGKTYACWMDNRDTIYQAYVDVIDTYQADLLALAYSNKSLEPQATRYNSARHLVKGGSRLHEQFSSGGEIFYRHSSNDGATWELAKRISAGDGNNGGGCLTYIEANSLHLVWQRQVASNQCDVIHSRSTDNGVSWSSPAVLPDARGIEVSSDQSEGAKPVVTVGKFDQENTLLAAFTSIHGLRFRTSTDDGQTWQVPTPDTLVGGNNARLRSPSLAGGESYISITYDYADDDNGPYSRIFNGSTWSNEYSVGKATSVPAGAYSSVAIDAKLEQ